MDEHTPESIPLLPHAVESEPDDRFEIGTFMQFNQVLQSILTDLDKMAVYARELELSEAGKLVSEMRKRLTERRFTVAVVGEFKRGKSTLINALLGADALPSDVLPCSATLNRVTYGLKEAVRIEHLDGRVVDVPFGELADYVTKLNPESKQRAATIKQAVIYFPTQYCANNVDVIDTPGLNDDQAMTDVTLSVLPHTDVAILVIMAQAPFSEYERDFLESKLLTSDLARVIFVVNSIDLFRRAEDTERVLNHVQDRIKSYVVDRAAVLYGADSDRYHEYIRKIGQPRVFGLSALKALQAKTGDDRRMMEESRFEVFETELQRFLTKKRGAITLQAPLARLVTVGREIDQTISLNEGALELARDDFEQAQCVSVAKIEEVRTRQRAELEAVIQRARRVREEIFPLLSSLPHEILAAVERTVDEAVIEASELANMDKLQDRIGQLVAREARRTADLKSQKISDLIQQAVVEEAERLGEFTQLVSSVQSSLAENFRIIQSESEFQHGTSGQAAAASAVATAIGLGGIYIGYRDAGLKGAAMGAAMSFGTLILGGVLLSAFSASLGAPAVIIFGLASMLPARWAVRGVFSGERIERFRSHYKNALSDKLRDDLMTIDLRVTVGDQILAIFEQIRDELERETEAVLLDAETQLSSLRTSYERQMTLGEGKYRQLEEIRYEARHIASNAARILRQLIETSEI